MEDAHIVFVKDNWGFFGVFDGHGGDQCSAFIARRMVEELEKERPKDDAAMKALALSLDREYLETQVPSGSTGTFLIIEPPSADEDRHRLRVGNVGDSRVLLGHADGTMFEGPGTDGGLTTDHKPDHADEKARIERTGGHVADVMGVARVNGDLAVSRAFGDGLYKQTGGPAQEDHPVSAEPEFTAATCASTDFVVLVCDGISEGEFPNREVVQLVAEELRAGGNEPDLGAAAASVCRKAIEAGSKDNLSCMIVLLGSGGKPASSETSFLPGPFDAHGHAGFRKAYAAMAEHAGLNLPEAMELRYSTAYKDLEELIQRRQAATEAQPSATEDQDERNLRDEIELYGEGPPSSLAVGTAERVKWFREHLDKLESDEDNNGSGGGGGMSREAIADLIANNPELLAQNPELGRMMGFVPETKNGPRIEVAALDVLKPAIENHPALKWHQRLESICGKRGMVKVQDDSDRTSQVVFKEFTAWLPQSALTEVSEEQDAESAENGGQKRKLEEASENTAADAANGDEKDSSNERDAKKPSTA